MVCCISKCRPHRHSFAGFNHVQQKLPSSQARATPPSPTSSTSSTSSFTCTTSNTITSTSSNSSALTSKDRSFSNEFLWSCYKENPHIIRIHSLKEASLSLVPTKAHSRKINPSPHQKIQKRVRPSSPTNLTRQKSFRKEPERLNSACNYLPGRTLRSPSRRFNIADKRVIALAATADRTISPKANYAAHCHSVWPFIRKDNLKPATPNNSLRHRQSCSNRIGSKIDETLY